MLIDSNLVIISFLGHPKKYKHNTERNLFYSPVNPRPPQVLPGQFHDSIEPFPESKIPLAQRLLTELSPTQHCIAGIVEITPEGLLGQELQIFVSQWPAGCCSEFQGKGLCHLSPRYLKKLVIDLYNLLPKTQYQATVT